MRSLAWQEAVYLDELWKPRQILYQEDLSAYKEAFKTLLQHWQPRHVAKVVRHSTESCRGGRSTVAVSASRSTFSAFGSNCVLQQSM